MDRLIILYTFSLLVLSLPAQDCGTVLSESPPDHYSQIPQDQYWTLTRSGGVDSIGIAVHTVDGNTSEPDTYNEVQRALDEVNILFAEAGMHFFICFFEEIQGNAVYTKSQVQSLNADYFMPRRLNLYLMASVTSGGFPVCGFATFPWQSETHERFIALDRDCLDNGSTLAHELGHFFGLLHTHDGFHGAEFVNGTNCSTAGDLLCDTPADPKLSNANVLDDCEYTGTARDPLGDMYEPNTALIMSYAPKLCRWQFSDGQNAIMRFYLNELRENFIDHCEDLHELTVTRMETRPSIDFSSQIEVDVDIFSSVPVDSAYGISFYISDAHDKLGTFLHKQLVVPGHQFTGRTLNMSFPFPPDQRSGSQFLTAIIDEDQEYDEYDERNNEYRISFDLDNRHLDNAVLFPNPADDVIYLFHRTPRIYDQVEISLFDQYGRKHIFEKQFYNHTEVRAKLDISLLDPGLYYILIDYPRFNRQQSFSFVKF